jgi:hypothetical protein
VPLATRGCHGQVSRRAQVTHPSHAYSPRNAMSGRTAGGRVAGVCACTCAGASTKAPAAAKIAGKALMILTVYAFPICAADAQDASPFPACRTATWATISLCRSPGSARLNGATAVNDRVAICASRIAPDCTGCDPRDARTSRGRRRDRTIVAAKSASTAGPPRWKVSAKCPDTPTPPKTRAAK